ncbi:MAG: glycosyltransferase [Chloroflexi bacterium]|nr:glycosyltransferase [Chloroflexota bacterium]
MARILFLTQVLPYPLDAGPKIRAYYVLRHLAQQHEVTLVSFVRQEDRAEWVAHLRSFCAQVHTVPMQRSRWQDIRALAKALALSQPAIIVRDEIAAMHAMLRDLMRGQAFDAIHADQTSMAQYALFARQCTLSSRPNVPVRLVLDAHNALFRVFRQLARDESHPLKRLFLAREARALERYEQQVYSQFDHVAFVTDQDRQSLPGISRGTTIPICVDPLERDVILPRPEQRLITHLGTMFWPPNIEGVLWFAREVFPRVLERVPDARLVIIGKRPPADIEALGQDGHIQVLGYVPDPTPYLAETAAFIVPLHAGAGMRVKILDAWGWGLPIVSTTLGAEGVEPREGEDLLIADDAQAFADAVVRLLEDSSLRATLREHGRQRAVEDYNWRTVYAAWDRVYQSVLQ